jgi:hypothetical protein
LIAVAARCRSYIIVLGTGKPFQQHRALTDEIGYWELLLYDKPLWALESVGKLVSWEMQRVFAEVLKSRYYQEQVEW